jgi:3-phenylpropionate/trans-cinnamate dioxygenase ferredoxin subunit
MALKICKVEDIKLGKALRVKIGDDAIALVHTKKGGFKAIADKCSHGEISLSEGFVDDDTIECWAHGAKFSLETGAPLNLPAYEPVAVYEVLIENGEIFIEYDKDTE